MNYWIDTKNAFKDLTNGIIKENPVLRIMIGLCPVLACSTTALDGLGMGIAATFVLIFTNFFVSLFRKVIPNNVRIPAEIVIASTFVTITDYFMHAFTPALYKSLGVFIPLIVVNCIVLGRPEAFAFKRPVFNSILDGIGMGLGFILVITTLGAIREIIGAGKIFGIPILGTVYKPMLIMILPPGGFLAIGFLQGFLNYFENKRA